MDHLFPTELVNDLTVKLCLTLLLGFIYGYERQRARKPIGFGTFIFVSTGACSLAIIAMSLPERNTIPLLASIVTGIGFLGAGALIRTGEKIQGFTSAALIWLFSIFGLSVGVGAYTVALSLYAIIWMVSITDHGFQRRGIGAYKKQLRLTFSGGEEHFAKSANLLQAYNTRLVAIQSDGDLNTITLSFDINIGEEGMQALAETLIADSHVLKVELE